MKRPIVVDASSLLAAAEPEHGEWAVALHDAHRRTALLAPALIASEAGHVVHDKRAREFGPSPERRAEALELLLGQLELVASDPAHRKEAALAGARQKVSFYDSEYLSLARATGGFLLTQDKALLKAAKAEFGPDGAFDLDGLRRALSPSAA